MVISVWWCFALSIIPMYKMINSKNYFEWAVWYGLALLTVLTPSLIKNMSEHYAKKLEAISAPGLRGTMVSTRFHSLCALPGKEIHSAECSSTTPYEKASLSPYSPLRLNTEGCESERSEASKAVRCE